MHLVGALNESVASLYLERLCLAGKRTGSQDFRMYPSAEHNSLAAPVDDLSVAFSSQTTVEFI